jgi:hypothetical protein
MTIQRLAATDSCVTECFGLSVETVRLRTVLMCSSAFHKPPFRISRIDWGQITVTVQRNVSNTQNRWLPGMFQACRSPSDHSSLRLDRCIVAPLLIRIVDAYRIARCWRNAKVVREVSVDLDAGVEGRNIPRVNPIWDEVAAVDHREDAMGPVVQLSSELCSRFGLDRSNEAGNRGAIALGRGNCAGKLVRWCAGAVQVFVHLQGHRVARIGSSSEECGHCCRR